MTEHPWYGLLVLHPTISGSSGHCYATICFLPCTRLAGSSDCKQPVPESWDLTAQRLQVDADQLPGPLSTAQAQSSATLLTLDGVLQAGLHNPDATAAGLPQTSPPQQPAPAQGTAVGQDLGTSSRATSAGSSSPGSALAEELPLSRPDLRQVASSAGPAGMRRIFSSKSQRHREDRKQDSPAPQPGAPIDTSHGPDASEPELPDSLAEQGRRPEGPGRPQAGRSREPVQGSSSQQQPSVLEPSRALTGIHTQQSLDGQTPVQVAGTSALPAKRGRAFPSAWLRNQARCMWCSRCTAGHCMFLAATSSCTASCTTDGRHAMQGRQRARFAERQLPTPQPTWTTRAQLTSSTQAASPSSQRRPAQALNPTTRAVLKLGHHSRAR